MTLEAFTEQAISNKLYLTNVFKSGETRVHIAFLLPESMWRPLNATWWRGKEASIIGGDSDGNYLLRCADGSVRHWVHSLGAESLLAPSVNAFWAGLTERI